MLTDNERISDVKYRMLSAIPNIKDDTIIDLLESEIPELELIFNLISDTQKAILIEFSNEYWIERWEKALKTKANTTDLEERRRFLATIISSKIKVSSATLEEITESFTGVPARVDVKNSNVYITLLGRMPNAEFNRFNGYLQKLIPAHLGIQIIVQAPMMQNLYTAAISAYTYSKVFFDYDKQGGKQ